MLFEPLRGHQRHFFQRGHQIERFFLANVMAENAREGRLPARMDFGPVIIMPSLAIMMLGSRRSTSGCLGDGMDYNDAALLAIFFKRVCRQPFAGFRPL